MELRHIRYFIAVAEELHFTRAANKLGLAQPALSQQIRALEEELGARLFERTNRSVALTHAGMVFLSEARGVLSSANQAAVRAARASRGEVGLLSIGYVLTATCRVLTTTMRKFRVSRPEVRLVLHDLNELQQSRQLLDGAIDFSFLRSSMQHEGVAMLPIERQRLSVLLPKQHPLAGSTKVSLADLAKESWIMVRQADFPTYIAFLYTQCHKARFEPLVQQPVRDIASVMWMVSAGMGIGFASTGIEDLHREGLVCRELTPAVPTCVWMHWRKDDNSPIVQNFVAAIRSEMKQVT